MLSSGRKARLGVGRLRRFRIIIATMVATLLLPIEVSDAGLLDLFKGSSKGQPAKRAAAPKPVARAKPAATAKRVVKPKRQAAKSAERKSVAAKSSAAKPSAPGCNPAKFRIVVDVGHTAESEGAMSARNVSEYVFNLRLAQRIAEKLKAEGFGETKLLVTEGRARASLVRRVAAASKLEANLFLSIHHDSVPTKFLEAWEFEGKKSHFSDRFSGYSVFVSNDNPEFKASLLIAELVAKEMKGQGLKYAEQYSQPIMGKYQHPLLNKETGVYSYDKLIVLKKTRMPAVLLEAGSIINREEELRIDSPEHRNIVSSGVAVALKAFCDSRWGILGPL